MRLVLKHPMLDVAGDPDVKHAPLAGHDVNIVDLLHGTHAVHECAQMSVMGIT
jgi:hypothetical protein